MTSFQPVMRVSRILGLGFVATVFAAAPAWSQDIAADTGRTSPSAPTATGQTTGKVQLQDIHFVKAHASGEVTVTDPATLQLLRSRKQGPGGMKILVPRDSELVELFRSALASRSRIHQAQLDFMGITDHAEFGAGRLGAKVGDLTVHEVATDPSQPMASISFNYTKITYCDLARC